MADNVSFILFSVVPIMQDVLLVLLIVRGIMTLGKRKADRSARLVSLSPTLLWVGIVCGGLLSIPVTLFRPDEMPDGVWYLFEVIILVCAAMQLAYCNETITYGNLTFEVSNLFGVKRTYDYGEITGVSYRGGDTVLHCGRRRIRLDAMSMNSIKFIAHADKAFYRRHKRNISVCKPKIDPMNGNLDTPWLYLCISLFVISMAILMIILSVRDLKPADGSLPNDSIEIRTSFSSYERTKEDGGTLQLHATNNEKPFSLSWLSGYEIPVPDPDILCNGEPYIIIVHEGKEEYQICSISTANNQPLISAYDRNTAYRNTQIVGWVFVLIFSVLGIVAGVFGILVGRHPERFPSWFCRFFYQDSAWT